MHWTDAETSKLEQVYPYGGACAVKKALPDRTAHAIRAQANRLGLSFEGRRFVPPARFRDWPTGRVTDSPLRDAIVGELADIRNREKVTALVIDTFKQVVHYRRTPSLATIIETAELLGLEIQTREGWLDFARRVAARLPSQEQE